MGWGASGGAGRRWSWEMHLEPHLWQLAEYSSWQTQQAWKRMLPPELWYTLASFWVHKLSPLLMPGNTAAAMSYGDVFAPPLPTPGRKLTVLYFTSGPYAASISDQRYYKLQYVFTEH